MPPSTVIVGAGKQCLCLPASAVLPVLSVLAFFDGVTLAVHQLYGAKNCYYTINFVKFSCRVNLLAVFHHQIYD